MKEALSSSETSIPIRATRRNIPKYTILHSHRRENLKSYILKLLSCLPIQIMEIINFLALILQLESRRSMSLSVQDTMHRKIDGFHSYVRRGRHAFGSAGTFGWPSLSRFVDWVNWVRQRASFSATVSSGLITFVPLKELILI
jgi:hypothetical protein